MGDDSKLAYIDMDGFFFSSASMTTTAPSADTATPRVAFSTASNAWTAQCSIGSPPGLSALIQGPSAATAFPDISTNWLVFYFSVLFLKGVSFISAKTHRWLGRVF